MSQTQYVLTTTDEEGHVWYVEMTGQDKPSWLETPDKRKATRFSTFEEASYYSLIHLIPNAESLRLGDQP